MELYLLEWAETERNERMSPLDCTHSVVVRAASSELARELASTKAGDEGAEFWLDSTRSTCVFLSEIGGPEVLHRGYR